MKSPQSILLAALAALTVLNVHAFPLEEGELVERGSSFNALAYLYNSKSCKGTSTIYQFPGTGECLALQATSAKVYFENPGCSVYFYTTFECDGSSSGATGGTLGPLNKCVQASKPWISAAIRCK